MHTFDYTYTFDHIGEQLKSSEIHILHHATNQTHILQVAVIDDQLSFIDYRNVPPLLADLIDLATAVHMADRHSKHDENMPRRLLLRLPIRLPEVLARPSIQKQLQDILYWFTEDQWFFEFIPYVRLDRSAQMNQILPLPSDISQSTRTALWSGGLDSFAGVYQQLWQDSTTQYLLFGTGSNHQIYAAQKRTAQTIEKCFPRRTMLVQLPFHLRDRQKGLKKNSSARSRGFVFMLMGAVCALQGRQNVLHIYENGVGAINLPFRKSEVGLDHSRSVHPLSLLYMGELLSSILEQPFSFENPFLFWTKAQMCQKPIQHGVTKEMFLTISCDSRHRKKPTQCGYCSSCLLRRQALAFHGIVDQTRYQITEETSRRRKPEDGAHYYAMLAQVKTMQALLATPDRWQRMAHHYPGLVDIVDKIDEHQGVMQDNLLRLYQSYVHEWDSDAVRRSIGPEFLT